MSIEELTQKVKAASKSRTHEDRIRILRAARVLDSNGNFDKKFFSSAHNVSNIPVKV